MSDKVKEWGLADIPEAPDYNRWEQAANEVKDKASKTELEKKADKSALDSLEARVAALESPAG